MKALLRFAGRVPQPVGVYRPPVVGMAGALPADLGICSYSVVDLEATRTPDEVVAYIDQVKQRAQELETEYAGRTFDAPAQEEFATLREIIEKGRARKDEFQARIDWIQSLGTEEQRVERSGLSLRPRAGSKLPDNLFDLTEYRSRTSSEEGMKALLVDGARKAAEAAVYPHEKATVDRSVAQIDKLLASPSKDLDPAVLARHILATGSPTYARAFAKKLIPGAELTNEERAAIAVVGTTTTGGFAVPYTLDPTLILTSDGQSNPLRQISRVEQVTGNTWKGLSSAGITVSRGPAENSAVTASSIAFGQPEVTVQPVKIEIPFSIESGEDWTGLQGELARVLQDGKDADEADQFVNGVGTTVYPGGVVATLDASSNVGTTGDGFDLEDLDRIVGRLPDRFEPNARFLGHRMVYGEIARLDRAAGGAQTYRPLAAGQPPTLLGYPAHNSSAMESDFATATNAILLFGDFRYFLIVDKIGMTVELDPHVRDTNGKWLGQRALLAHYRNSSVILADNAFRLLVVGVVTS